MTNRILFINPPISGTYYEWEEKLGSKLPALGLCSLSAYTIEKGFKTALLDAYNLGLSPESALKEVLEFSPTHIGITAMTINIFFAAEFAKLLKKHSPDTIIIIGGAHISATPEETMEMFPDFDIGVLGEGEETVVEILNSRVSPDRDLATIKGIIYRDKQGNLKKTEKRPYIKDLDKLPYPAWDCLPNYPNLYRPSATNYKRLPMASLVTSRGCPYQCTFCDRSVFGNNYRFFSPEYVIGLIEELKDKHGIREICFYDDTFTVNKSRLYSLCEYFIKNKLDITWSCLGRVDLVDAETLKLMKASGCWLISYGIESASQEILDIYCKKIALSQIENAVRITKEAGITTRGFFIIGGPKETNDTIARLKALLYEIRLDDIHISFFTPIPGSELYNLAHQYGKFNNNWRDMDVYTLNFIPYGMTKDLLLKYRSDLYKTFYFKPARLFRYFMLSTDPRRMHEILGKGLIFLKLLNKSR